MVMKAKRSPVTSYGVCILSVGLAVLLKLLLNPLMGLQELPFLTFFAAVMLSAWYGGMRAGLFATALAALASNYFFLEPTYSLSFNFSSLLKTSVFALEGGLISYLAGALHSAKWRSQVNLRKLQEEQAALNESEERFRLLIEGVKDYALYMLDPEGRIVSWNSGAEAIKGYQAHEILGQHFSRFYPPEDIQRGKPQQQMNIAIEEGRLEEEGWRVRKDGSRFWANAVFTALRDERGQLKGFSKLTRDITERKRAEEERMQLLVREQAARTEAEASEQRYRFLAESIPQIVWTARPDGYIDYYNQRWFDYAGMTLEETQGWGWQPVMHPDDLQQSLDMWKTAVETGKSYEIEHRFKRGSDGTYRWHLGRGLPLRDSDGQIVKWFGTWTDIEELKQAEAEIRQLNETLERRVMERTAQLEEANKELEAFSYSVSHDLRSPLRHISGFAELLQKKAASTLDESSLRYLNTIIETAKHAGTLIDDLLAFSRMARNEMRHTIINMDRLVQEVRRDIESETKERHIIWHIGELPPVHGDPSMLKLVVQNLFSNAIKYTRTRTTAEIEIGSTSNEHESVFFVRDNGVGFDMRYVDKLFGVFQRLHSLTEFEGTGIGLANVRRIIYRHGGRTWAEGSVGDGATFYFALPKLLEK